MYIIGNTIMYSNTDTAVARRPVRQHKGNFAQKTVKTI